MTIFVAVDPSIVSTGIAAMEVLDNGKIKVLDIKTIKPVFREVGKDKSLAPTRLDKKIVAYDLLVWVTKNIPAYKDAAFYIFENYSYGAVGHLADLGEMNGMFKLHIKKTMGKPIDVIAPQSVKKFILGTAKSKTKSDVRAGLEHFVENFHELKFENFDESDAVAIGVSYAIKMGAIPRLDGGYESPEG